MENIHISMKQYLPIVELFYNNKVREEFKFLRNNTKVKQRIRTMITAIKEPHQYPYYLGVGPLRWKKEKDNWFYFDALKEVIYKDITVRPLIPLRTKTINAKLDKPITEIKDYRKEVKLYPNLVLVIEYKYIIEKSDITLHELKNIIEAMKDQVCNQREAEVIKIQKSFFEETTDVPLKLSALHIFVEIPNNHRNILLNNTKELKHQQFLRECEISTPNSTLWYVIYKKNTPKVLRMRINEALNAPIMIKLLIRKLFFQLKNAICQQLNYEEKIEFLKYILASTNPEHYSSTLGYHYYIPFHYQRTIVEFSFSLRKERTNFSRLLKALEKTVEKWEAHLKNKIILGRSYVLSPLVDLLDLTEPLPVVPNLDGKERATLKFLIYTYKKGLEGDNTFNLRTPQKTYYGAVTANKIRENVNKWLDYTNQSKKVLVDSDFTPTPPKILKELARKSLVKMKRSKSGRVSYYFYLNLENDYVQNQIKNYLKVE